MSLNFQIYRQIKAVVFATLFVFFYRCSINVQALDCNASTLPAFIFTNYSAEDCDVSAGTTTTINVAALTPALPGPAVVVSITRGRVLAGAYLRISGFAVVATAATSVPLLLTVSGTSFLDGTLRIGGAFPPDSQLTITGVAATQNLICALPGYGSSFSISLLLESMTLHPRAVLLFANASFSATTTSAPVPIYWATSVLYQNASIRFQRVNASAHGANSGSSNCHPFFLPSGTPYALPPGAEITIEDCRIVSTCSTAQLTIGPSGSTLTNATYAVRRTYFSISSAAPEAFVYAITVSGLSLVGSSAVVDIADNTFDIRPSTTSSSQQLIFVNGGSVTAGGSFYIRSNGVFGALGNASARFINIPVAVTVNTGGRFLITNNTLQNTGTAAALGPFVSLSASVGNGGLLEFSQNVANATQGGGGSRQLMVTSPAGVTVASGGVARLCGNWWYESRQVLRAQFRAASGGPFLAALIPYAEVCLSHSTTDSLSFSDSITASPPTPTNTAKAHSPTATAVETLTQTVTSSFTPAEPTLSKTQNYSPTQPGPRTSTVTISSAVTPSSTVTVTVIAGAASPTENTVTVAGVVTSSTSLSLLAVPSPSRTPPPPLVPRVAVSSFVVPLDTPYAHRYFYYAPVRLVGAYSGVPLLWSETYAGIHAMRFQVLAVADGGVVRLGRASADSVRANAGATVAIVKGSTFVAPYAYSVAVGRGAAQPVGAFLLTTDRHRRTDTPANFSCGDLMTAAPTGAAVVPAGSDASITVAVPAPVLGGPRCAASSVFAGLVYSSIPFSTAQALAYAVAVPDGVALDSDTAVVAAVKSHGWRGATTANLVAAGTERWTLVGNTSNTGTTSAAPITETRSFALAHPATLADQGAVRIAADTTDAVFCAVPDTAAYAATYVPPGGNLTVAVAAACYQWDTVEDLHAACAADALCVGFTTVLMPEAPGALTGLLEVRGKERPQCTYAAGTPQYRDEYFYQRAYYAKPDRAAASRCRVVVARSGSVAVRVQQTGLERSSVVVRVDGRIAAECGVELPFANGYGGLDGRCGVLALCAVAAVQAGSTVEVSAPDGLSQGGCANSLGVLFEQVTVDAVQVPLVTEAPIERLPVGAFAVRNVRKLQDDDEPVRIFVFAAARAALGVTQSGYACTSPTDCPASVVGFSSPFACQTCGGAAGFFRGARQGRSDACDAEMFCGDFVALAGAGAAATTTCGATQAPSSSGGSATAPYTGMLSITANISALRGTSKACSGLLGRVYAERAPNSVPASAVPVFPLRLGLGTFATLLAVSPNTNSTAAAALLGNSALGPNNMTRLLRVGPASAPLDALHIPWGAAITDNGATPLQARLHPNVSLACAIDHSEGLAARCTFPVPLGATRARVRAAQIDFVQSSMTVTLRAEGIAPATSAVTCGGTEPFGSTLGGEGRCNGYATCMDQFLFARDADAANATEATLVVDLPHSLRHRGCDLSAVVIVDFSRPERPQTACKASEFECPGEQSCLPISKVCDRVQDCARGADEATCFDRHPLPGEAFCSGAGRIDVPNGLSSEDCRRYAVAYNSAAYTVFGNGTCVVYNMSDVGKLLANPAGHVCSTPNATTYLALPAGVDTLRLCRASIHCSGHGTLVDGLNAVPPCACDCFLGYEGSHCNTRLSLDTITHVVVALPVAQLTESTILRRAAVASALQLRSSLVRVTCDAVVPMNATAVYVECEVAPVKDQSREAYFHARVLLAATGLTRINAALREQQLPPALFLTTRGVMTPLVANEVCSDVANASSCAVVAAFERLRIAVAHNVSVRSLRVTVTDDDTTTTQAGQRRQSSSTTVTCAPASTLGLLGCTVSACDVALRGSVRANVSVTDVEFAPATPLTGVCAQPMVTTFSHAVIGNVDTTTNSTVRNTETDYTGFFAGGIAVFVVGMFVLLLAAVCAARYRNQIAEIAAEVDTTNASAVDRALAWLLVRQAHHARVERGGRANARSWASGLTVAGVSCGVIASFLVIYYRTAYGVTSNFSVLVEEFSDDRCGASDTAGMPRRIFAVPPGTFECTKMLATGEATGASYALGHCTGSDGRYDATVRVAGSQGQCRKAPQLTVKSGACVPIQQLLPSATRATFAQITCSDVSAVAARTTRLTELTRVPDDFVNRHVTNPPITAAAPVQFGDRFEWAFLAGTTTGQSSSNTAGTVDAFATSADLDANDDAGRLVLQTLACTFRDGAALAAASTCMKPTLEALQTNLSTRTLDNVPSLETLAPRTGDQPVGFLFGRFGSSAPVTWAGAGATAHRYYGVAGTIFDMGTRFPFDPNALVDGEGYTISLFLRADAATQGFAYAVTDAFENADSGAVHTLDRLAKIIDNGQSGAEWFNDSYRVYHGLYVNGPGAALELVYADPTAIAGRVALLEFDLEEIGATRVFNGLWHHIAIVFLVENSKARAQLVLDGETSSTRKGWSACVSDFPQPVRTLGTTAPVYNADRDTVARGGVLVTGYLNGGVAGLRAEAEEVPPTLFLRRGTTAMREYSAFPRQETLGLGAGLLALGAVMILSILWTVRREVYEASAVTESSVEVATDFYVATATLLAGTHLFGKKMTATRSKLPLAQSPQIASTNDENMIVVQQQRSSDVSSTDECEDANTETISMRPIRFATALRWLRLDAERFAAVMHELQVQSPKPEHDLFLILYRAGLSLYPETRGKAASHEIKSPKNRSGGAIAEEVISCFTCDEWNDLVTTDLQCQIQKGRGHNSKSIQWLRFPRLWWTSSSSENQHREAIRKHVSSSIQLQQESLPPEKSDDELFLFLSGKDPSRVTTAREEFSVDMDADLALCEHSGDLFRGLLVPTPAAEKEQSLSSSSSRPPSSAPLNVSVEKNLATDGFDKGQLTPPSVTASVISLACTGDNLPSGVSLTKKTGEAQHTSETRDVKHFPTQQADKVKVTNTGNKKQSQKIYFRGVKISGVRGTAAQSTTWATQTASASGSDQSAVGSAFFQVSAAFAPVIATVQTVYVWGTSLHLPSVYDDYFRGLFSFVSFDWAAAFASIPTLVTPLIQVFVGLIAIGLVLHFMLDDNRRFEKRLAQYVWRRDELEGGGDLSLPPVTSASPPTAHDETAQHVQKRSSAHGGLLRRRLDLFSKELIAAIADEGVPDAEITVSALPLAEARKIDRLCEKFERSSSRKPSLSANSAHEGDDDRRIVSFNERGIPLLVSHLSSSVAQRDGRTTKRKEMKARRGAGHQITSTPSINEEVYSTSSSDECAIDNNDSSTSKMHKAVVDKGDETPFSSFSSRLPSKNEYFIQTVTPFLPYPQQIIFEKRRQAKEGRRAMRSQQNENEQQTEYTLLSHSRESVRERNDETPANLSAADASSVSSPSTVVDIATKELLGLLAISPRLNDTNATTTTRTIREIEQSNGQPGQNNRDDLTNEGVTTKVGKQQQQQAEQHVISTALSLAASRRMEPLRTVGCRCPRHPQTRLAPQQQTEIWPFSNVPTCCMVVGGKRCGARCGTVYSCGQTYTAPRKNDDSYGEQELRVCTYALCQQHIRLSLVEQLWSVVVGLVRSVRIEGYGWVACAGLAMLASIAYTPVIKTALMILGCHPFYQCEFKNCWQHMDQKYALAVFLCIVVLCLYGVGLPAAVVFVLSRRWRMMSVFFVDPSYNGRYEQHQPNNSDCHENAANVPATFMPKNNGKPSVSASMSEAADIQDNAVSVCSEGPPRRLCTYSSTLSSSSRHNSCNEEEHQETRIRAARASVSETEKGRGEVVEAEEKEEEEEEIPTRMVESIQSTPLFVPSPRWPRTHNMDTAQALEKNENEDTHLAKDTEQMTNSDEKEEGKKVVQILIGDYPSSVKIRHEPPTVSRAEWARFVATDTTAMAQQYQTVVAQWMFFAGFVIAFKVLVLLPAIFLEPRSISQRYGIAAVELVVAAFAFLTSTQISPITLVMLRAASVHQMLLLGLQNIDLVLEHDYDTQQSADMSSSSSRVPRYADTPGAVGNYMVLVTVTYLLLCGAVIVGAVAAPILSQRLRQRQLKTFLNRNGLDYAGSISLYLDPYHSLTDPSASFDCSFQRKDTENRHINISLSSVLPEQSATPPPRLPPPRWLEELQYYCYSKQQKQLEQRRRNHYFVYRKEKGETAKHQGQQYLKPSQGNPASAFYHLVLDCVDRLRQSE